jgi:hypothetical protein
VPEVADRPPFDRSRWPEYADQLGWDARTHRLRVERFMEWDGSAAPLGDWCRRFEIGAAGWALLEAHISPARTVRAVVYPANISISGIGVMLSEDLPLWTLVRVHLDRLVCGSISLVGDVRRSIVLEGGVRVAGIAWASDSRQALIEHLAPQPVRGAPVGVDDGPEWETTRAALGSMYAENRLGNWAAIVGGD